MCMCMCMCMYITIYTHIYIYIYICIHIYIYIVFLYTYIKEPAIIHVRSPVKGTETQQGEFMAPRTLILGYMLTCLHAYIWDHTNPPHPHHHPFNKCKLEFIKCNKSLNARKTELSSLQFK